MIKKFAILMLLISLGLSGISTVQAEGSDTGRLWKDHAKPYDFMFENLIDNHQQMKLQKDGRLHGFIYIQFTGETIDGVPVAKRADCTNPLLDCRVGWEVIGIPVSDVKLSQRGPRLWDLNQASLTVDSEYVHFQWVGTPKKPCGLTVGFEYDGYLFKRTAATTFYWLGGNPGKEVGRLVTPGVDLHTNRADLFVPGGDGGEEEDEGDCSGH